MHRLFYIIMITKSSFSLAVLQVKSAILNNIIRLSCNFKCQIAILPNTAFLKSHVLKPQIQINSRESIRKVGIVLDTYLAIH
jgi:hypothetical protein